MFEAEAMTGHGVHVVVRNFWDGLTSCGPTTNILRLSHGSSVVKIGWLRDNDFVSICKKECAQDMFLRFGIAVHEIFVSDMVRSFNTGA